MSIRLVPFALGGLHDFVPGLAGRVRRVLKRDVRIVPASFDPELFFDPSRGQYHSTRLLERLLAEPGPERTVLGVTAVDLFVPILTYVFGEAQLDGRAAVVSLARLDPVAYGLPPDPRQLLDRATREAVHELGHTYGLLHCPVFDCVMHASTYAEEIDLKDERPCPNCRKAIEQKEAAIRASPGP